MLDVFHAVAHVGDAAKAVWTRPSQATPRREAGIAALLADGKPDVDRWIGTLFAELPGGSDGEPLRALSAYLSSNPTRLNDAGRLAQGRSIGSGMVEGAIKHSSTAGGNGPEPAGGRERRPAGRVGRPDRPARVAQPLARIDLAKFRRHTRSPLKTSTERGGNFRVPP